jgi:Family of unknown function (DUF6843)
MVPEDRKRKLWALTATNILVALLLLFFMFGSVVALSVIAPKISAWPILVTVVTGVFLSVASLRFANTVVPSRSRIFAKLLNGSALSLHIIVIGLFLSTFLGSTSETYIIPVGYQGDVYVIFDVPDGQATETGYHKSTYRIPSDGILRTRTFLPQGWTHTEYFFQAPNGSLHRINNLWLTTIPKTPENVSNTTDVGVFFPHGGTTDDANGCPVRFHEFYVGTKANLLTTYKERGLLSYLRQNPINCVPRQ